MSDKAKGRIWEIELPHSEKWVLHALADHSDHNGQNIYPGLRLVMYKTDYSKRQVLRIISSLLGKGVLALDDPARPPSRVNPYHINWQACTFKAPFEPARRGRPPGSVRKIGVNMSPDKEKIGDKMAHNNGKRDANMSPNKINEVTPGVKIGDSQGKLGAIPERENALIERTILTDSINDSNQHLQSKISQNGSTNSIGAIPPSAIPLPPGIQEFAYHGQLAGPAPPGPGQQVRPNRLAHAPPLSQYINAVVTDYSRELGDEGHLGSNISQALRLWQSSRLPEKEFGELLHAARKRVREYQGKNGRRGIENKMAYFFTVLRELVSEHEQSKQPTGGG